MEKGFISKVMKKIRKPMYDSEINTDRSLLYFERTLLPPTKKNKDFTPNYFMPFLVLVTNPCSWLKKSGGCVMCGYSNLASFKRKISGDEVYDQFKRGLNLIKQIPSHEMIAIGTPGSFLDKNEVPIEIQQRILKELQESKDIEYINIESRTEYITKETLDRIVEVMDDPYKLAIGVGLESLDEKIREKCVNKGLSTEDFIKSIDLLKSYNISPTVYVTLGKPFLDEKNNIEDAVNSINFAFDNKADRVVLLRIGLQDNSLTKLLYEYGKYKPSKTWSIVEVIKRINPERRANLLIAAPRLPKHMPIDECPCSDTVLELLMEYKGTLDYRYIKAIDSINCECKEEWKKELEKSKPIEENIEEGYRFLEKIIGD